MYQKAKALFITILTMLFTFPVFAHPGHDHTQWSSIALHFVFYGSILVLGAVLVFAAIKQLKKLNS